MKMMFLLLHNAVMSELLHHRIEVVISSPDSEVPVDIIHNKWSVITYLALLKDCECCDSEPAMESPILQAWIILSCFPLPSIPLSSSIFEYFVLLHLINLKTVNNILFFITLIHYLLLQFCTYFYYDFFFELCC